MTYASTIAMTNCQEALLTLTNHINSGMDAMGDWEHKYGLVSQKLNRVMEENHKLRKQRDEVKMDNFKYEGFGGLKTQYKIMKEELDKLKTASNIDTAEKLEKLSKMNKQKKKKLEQFEKTIGKQSLALKDKDNEIQDLRKTLTDLFEVSKKKDTEINNLKKLITDYLDIAQKKDIEMESLKKANVGLDNIVNRLDMKLDKRDIEIAGYKTMMHNNAHELLELTNNEQRMRAIINKFVDQELYNKIIEEYYSENEHNITDNIEITGADIHNQALANNQQLKDKKKNKTKSSKQLKLELTEPTSPKQIITGTGKTKIRHSNKDNMIDCDLVDYGNNNIDTKNSIYANIRKKHKQIIDKKKHLIEYTIIKVCGKPCEKIDFRYDYKLTIPITTP